MEDQQKNKKIEDLPTLYQKKYKLIKEKNDLSKTSDISRIKSTDNLKFYSTWDLMLMQIKHLALDFHEERKWKKGICYNLVHKASQKYKKNKTKEKINDLYKKSCCLYLAMSVNLNIKEICNGKNNAKMNNGLNQLIKDTMSVEDLGNDIMKKKETIEKLKNKVEKVFGDKFKNAESLLKIFKQMENMIKQNDNNLNNPNSNTSFMIIDTVTGKEISEIPQKNIDNEINRINKIYEKIDKTNSNVNLNSINIEVNNLLQELEEYSTKNNNVELIFPSEENDIFANEIKLFYENPNDNDQFKALFNSEKLQKSNAIFLPDLQISKLSFANNIVEIEDKNSFEVNFEKIFPPVFRISEKSDIVMYEEVKKKESKQVSSNQQYESLLKLTSNLKISILQKCVYLWGLSRFGLNLSIMYDLPSIFPFSKSINFDKEEELQNYLTEMLKEFDIDLEGSSFEIVKPTKDSFVFNIRGDPPLLNCTDCNFDFNSILYKLLRNETREYPLYISKKMQQNVKITAGLCPPKQISFLEDNKFLKNQKEKDKIKNQIKSHLIDVSNIVMNNFKIFVHKEKDVKVSNKSVSNSLTQNQIDYMTNKVDFNIDGFASKVLEKTKPIKNSLIEGIAFYSQPSIQREWETLRTPWYQNNFQCKPKFRKYSTININSAKMPPIANSNQIISSQNYNPNHNMIARNFSDGNMRA